MTNQINQLKEEISIKCAQKQQEDVLEATFKRELDKYHA